MNYVVVHAPVGTSVVLAWEDGQKPTRQLLKLREEKEAFIDGITAADTCYLELGGPSDRLALACHIVGAAVWRVPIAWLAKELELTAEADRAGELLFTEDGQPFDEEDESGQRSILDEDEKKLAARKLRAEQIWRWKLEGREFYPLLDVDVPVLILIVLWKGFHLMQRTRIATHQRLLAVYRDLYLVTLAQQKVGMTEDQFVLDQISRDQSFRDVPPEARERYLASIKTGDVLDEAVTEREKTLAAELGRQLEKLEMYQRVFKLIPRCGPLTAARMIGAVSDIRRFPTLAKFRAYFGLHHFADGSRARPMRGRPSNWSHVGKQGCYQFSEQIGMTPPGANEWRDLLDRRRAYELIKILRANGREFVPSELQTKFEADSVLAMELEDLDLLLAMIDGLRGLDEIEVEGPEGKKGKKVKLPYRQYLEAKYPNKTLCGRITRAYEDGRERASAKTKKLVKGVKAKALDKAKRFLRQWFLEHLYEQLWTLRHGGFEERSFLAPGTQRKTAAAAAQESRVAG